MGGVRVLVMLLVFGLWPGLAEAIVDVGHLLADGTTAHSTDCGDEGPGGCTDEGQCSALCHFCGCHAPPPTTASSRVVVRETRWSELAVRSRAPVGALVMPADGAATRATRPPIA